MQLLGAVHVSRAFRLGILLAMASLDFPLLLKTLRVTLVHSSRYPGFVHPPVPFIDRIWSHFSNLRRDMLLSVPPIVPCGYIKLVLASFARCQIRSNVAFRLRMALDPDQLNNNTAIHEEVCQTIDIF
jgi:hypothetical protein